MAPPDVGALIGPQAGPAVDAQAGVEEQAKAVMYQMRDLMAKVEGFARQYPNTSDEMRQIKELLGKAMTKAVQTTSGPEAPGPPVIG